jgi:hypothetical protein
MSRMDMKPYGRPKSASKAPLWTDDFGGGGRAPKRPELSDRERESLGLLRGTRNLRHVWADWDSPKDRMLPHPFSQPRAGLGSSEVSRPVL